MYSLSVQPTISKQADMAGVAKANSPAAATAAAVLEAMRGEDIDGCS
jgi:hypothetical protein